MFTFSDRKLHFCSTLKKIEKGKYTGNIEGGGSPSHSDRKSHFILEVKYYTTNPPTHTLEHPPTTTLDRVGVGRGSKIWCKANISPKLNYRHLVHSRQ